LYSWIAPITGAQLAKIKTKSPISIPEDACPLLIDGDNGELVTRLEVKSGGAALTSICDLSIDLFRDSEAVYRIAPSGETIKFELADNSVIGAPISIQDRPTLQPWEDTLEGFASVMNTSVSSKEIWRDLMTPNLPLNF
jgi:hypothetical protein